MAKKMPEIKGITVVLTPQEVLGLRHIHSNWANSNGNAPFCDAMSDQLLEKLGGYLKDCDPLWEHPVAKKWYNNHADCCRCGRYYKKEELTFQSEDDGLVCHECLEDGN